jgi:hypothetical protein
MEEMHSFWMEACCDINDLIKLLKGEKQRWTDLEDLAVQSEPGSQDFEFVQSARGRDEIMKRKQFLELE